jgi:hypothetical protein
MLVNNHSIHFFMEVIEMDNEEQNSKDQDLSPTDLEVPQSVEPWSTPVTEGDTMLPDLDYASTKTEPEYADDMPRPVEAWEEVLDTSSPQAITSDINYDPEEKNDSFPPAIPVWKIPGNPSKS